MDKARWDRWAPFSGVVFVGLIVATFFLPAKTPPNAGDSAGEFVSFITAHRTALLVAAYLSGLAVFFFAWFLGSIVSRMRAAGEQRLAAVALVGGAVTAGLGLLGCMVQGALAWNLVQEADAGTVKTLTVLPMFGFAFPLAAFVGAVSVVALRTKLLPQWLGGAGIVAALWFLVGGAALARHGFFSPRGAYGFIGFIAFLVWMLLTSAFLLSRAPAAEETPAAAPAAM